MDTESRLTALEAAVRAMCSPRFTPSAEVLKMLDAPATGSMVDLLAERDQLRGENAALRRGIDSLQDERREWWQERNALHADRARAMAERDEARRTAQEASNGR